MGRLSTTERKAYYLRSLEDHRQIMRSAIEGIGRGDLVQALMLAVSIRVLMHESGNSVPLLKRLRNDYHALQIRTPVTPEPHNYSPFAGKITIMHLPFSVRLTGNPPLSMDPHPDMSAFEFMSLAKWWMRPVLRVPGCAPLSRREVVLGVANKEGAHVDDEMSENYRRVLESEPLKFTAGEQELGPINVTRFTVGAAGIELLDLLDRELPEPAQKA